MADFQRFPSFFSFIIVSAVAAIEFTDGSSITWFEPPPFQTVTDPATISKANKSLIIGSFNEEVNCNFTLTADLSLITVSMKFEASSIATYVQSKHAISVQPRFESRFNATWVPDRLKLILLNVTSADKGQYRCEVLTVAIGSGSAQTWERIIQVSLLEKGSPSVSTTPRSAPEKESSSVSTTPTSAPEKESSSVSTTPTSAPEKESSRVSTTPTKASAPGTTTHVYYGQARELVFVVVLVSILNSLL